MNTSLLAKALRSLADAIDAPAEDADGVRLLSYKAVAERLDVAESQARHLGSLGYWPEVRLETSVRVRESDLEAAIKAHVVKARRVA